MATETPQESLLGLWESIPEDLRPSGPYTFEALSGSVASLVTKAQQASQCGHKDELAKALGGVRTPNISWKKLLESTSQAAWQSSRKGSMLRKDMPAPFTGVLSDYRRWKAEIRNWAILNGAAPGNTLAAAVLLNMTGTAREWAINMKPSQYSMTDGVPASATDTLEAILKDMDNLFFDYGADARVREKFYDARQGTRRASEYNIYFRNMVLEFGCGDDYARHHYIDSLRADLRIQLRGQLRTQDRKDEPFTLTDCMEWTSIHDSCSPAPKKRGKRGPRQGI